MDNAYSVIQMGSDNENVFNELENGKIIPGAYYSSSGRALLCIDENLDNVIDTLGVAKDDLWIQTLEEYLDDNFGNEDEMEIKYSGYHLRSKFSVEIRGHGESCAFAMGEMDFSTITDWYAYAVKWAKNNALDDAEFEISNSLRKARESI